MTENHEQIPLLAKLRISYYCNSCHKEIQLRSFYIAMDAVVAAASVEDGKLICPTCRDSKKECLCHFDVINPIGTARYRIIHKDCPIHNLTLRDKPLKGKG